MATTKDEQTKEDVQAHEDVISKKVTKKDILDDYNKGLNYYQLAQKYFDSESDDSVERVRSVVEAE